MSADRDVLPGWRWLLPATGAGDVRDVLVVDVDDETDSPTDIVARLQQVDAVALVGDAARVRAVQEQLDGFASQRSYGMLPPERPRVLVPLARADWARAGLALHRPGRAVARAAVGAARLLAGVGVLRPLFRRQLCIATRERSRGPAAVPGLPDVQDLALYLGTADDDRKTVALPLGAAAPDRIVKLAETPRARIALQHELATLQALAATPLARSVPVVLAVHDTASTLALHLEYRPRRAAQASSRALREFLVRLGALDRGEVAVDTWLQASSTSPASPSHALYAALHAHGGSLDLGRTHGDFAPWNFAPTRGGLFVFDWEASRRGGVALADAMHLVLQPALRVGAPPPARALLARMLAAAAPVADALGIARARLPAHAAAFLLQWCPERDDAVLTDLRAAVAEALR